MLAGRQLFALSHDDVHLHMMQKLLGKQVKPLITEEQNQALSRFSLPPLDALMRDPNLEPQNPKQTPILKT